VTTRREFVGLSASVLGYTLISPTGTMDGEPSSSESVARAARAVIARAVGARAADFELELGPSSNQNPACTISALDGRVRIKGNSSVALCRGAYTYLRQSCNSMVTWSSKSVHLPSVLPDCNEVTISSPYKFVQYYNVCTYGYSTAFWDWERWEREIDWMALHGINMPLAMEGQEYVWQKVWKQIGLSQAELDRFSTGPAQLPWHRMGNINYFDGPLPQNWIKKKRDLQQRILARMQELGMSPVAPAFAGFVPEGFKRIFPRARTFTEIWSGESPRISATLLLDPHETDLYREIGGQFIRSYREEFGRQEFYLADSFNEVKAPVDPRHRQTELAQFGRTIYESMLAGDPNAKWVMQGWMFREDAKFWDNESIAAFLSQVPNDRALIIDFSNDWNASDFRAGADPTAGDEWILHNSFFGKQWINGMIHTFGGNNNVRGNLPLIALQPAAVLSSEHKGNLVGWGMDPEGIENNEVVFELMTDVGWSSMIDLDSWIPAYCRARYGNYPPAMERAWNLLRQSAYLRNGYWNSGHTWQFRPSLTPSAGETDSGPVFQEAVDEFLSCHDEFKSNELYRNDLIEFVSQAAGGHVDRRLAAACAAHKAGKPQERDDMANQSLNMLLRIDALMNVRQDRRLETWVTAARSWAATPDEATYMDSNARRLITYWGWSGLNDYASRVWSGLIRDYYVGRWKTFFDGLRDGNDDPYLLDAWETAWLVQPLQLSPPQIVGDVASEARAMLEVCKGWT
jgi:alpha-N-acetylglucosaminidase